MRKIMNRMLLVAASAMTFASCQMEITDVIKETFSVNLDLNANVEKTKTYLDEDNVVLWGKDEAVTLYVQDGSEGPKFINSTSTDAFDGNPSASFNFTINDVTEAESYSLGGIYPASVSNGITNNNAKAYKIALPATQNAENGKYDPSAFIMVLKPQIVDQIPSEYTASFRRAVALNKITLTGVEEDILSVEVTVPEDKYLAGRRYVDLTTAEFGEIYENGGRTNSVKINSNYESINNSIDVWFTSWGVELSEGEELIVKMTSETTSYTRSIAVREEGIKFWEGDLNKLTINMSHEDTVVETLENIAGEYLIAAMPGEWTLMSGTCSSYYTSKTTGVTTTTEEVLCSDFYNVENIDAYVWTVAKMEGGYSLQNNATGKYLTLTSDGNNANATDHAVALDITVEEKKATVVHKNYTDRELEYNSTNPRFAFYKNTQKDIYFIPWVADTTPRIVVSSNSLNVGADDEEVTFTYTLRNTEDTPKVAVADGATMTNVEATAASGTVTVTFDANTDEEEKTATLVLSVEGASNVEVVITQAAWKDSNAGGGEVTITLILNTATTGSNSTSYVSSAKSFTYEDVTYSVNNWNPKTLQVRGNKTTQTNLQQGENFMLRNTTPIPGKIKSIEITYTSGTIVASNTYAAVGASEITSQSKSNSTPGTAGTSAVTWTFADGGSYFAIGMIKGGTSGTALSGAITIVYETN